METDDRRTELLERAYRRGYELRLRRRRRWAMSATLVVIAVVGGIAAGVARTERPAVSVSKTTTPSTAPTETACAASIPIVPASRVPRDVAAWAGGSAVLGNGALWTIRSAIDVHGTHQPQGDWFLKFPWLTRPFGLPTITGQRLDGPGTFHADVNPATDSRGTWVVSSLEFSRPGCWQVTGRYRGSTLRFRVQVGTEPNATPAVLTPTEIVALEANGWRIAVMSAATGKVIRVLAQSQGLVRYDPTLAVTPDGATVYFSTSRRPTAKECAAGLVEEVARVAVRGGPVTVVGPGVFPAVSPNGRFLAYVRNAASPCGSNDDELVVLDLQSGVRRTFVSSPRVDLAFLSWAPDSIHLAFDNGGAAPAGTSELIDTATAHTLDDAAPIPHATNSDWGGYLGTAGAGIGVTPHNGSNADPATVVELDTATGAVTRTLFTIPGGLAVGNVADGPEDTLHADRSGRDVLAIGLLPVSSQVRHGALYRWHDGGAKPTLVADQIWAAVWLEPNSPTASASP